MKPRPIRSPGSNERTQPPFRPGRWQRWRDAWDHFHLRDAWWRLLDFFEASRAARLGLYLTATGLVLGGVLWFGFYPAWQKRNAVKIARDWLDAGQLRYAAEAAQRAAVIDPTNPEPWLIAAQLARIGGQQDVARDYARRAAALAPDNPDIVIGWAAAALRADQADEADEALDTLSVEVQAASPHVQRLRGELARRSSRLTAARNFFEAARRLEGPGAVNEVPLGLILLQSTDPAERRRGVDLLSPWTADAEWGATALRTLLAHALDRGDQPAMLRWAEALRSHPGCTVADMTQCLLALATADRARYTVVLDGLKRDHAVTPQAAAQLLSWLNAIGRGADAVAWMATLPAAGMQRPPLAVVGAEALRQAGDWAALRTWTSGHAWGEDADFLRWAYGLEAALQLGDNRPADELRLTLYSHAELNSAHALFSGSLLYGWGRTAEAVELWWHATHQEGPSAIDALGSLARHFQVQRDAEGQYRVFRQLHLLRPADAAIGNNYAFFATLTGRDQRLAEQIARANLTADPRNVIYVATAAFVHFRQNRLAEARRLLETVASEVPQSPALAFSYGLVLAADGGSTKGRQLLDGLPPDTLTTAEVELIRATLKQTK
ncbi:invasion protein regulator [Lacunisphaera limnophila]|uniref:Invasion protein regulator n=1 Tax=Lacunisphaera limnophila TaxID=1838286 RepID=A0A1D8AZ45_9BACT|nr:hypothetical protein [Lacunisphaera limnophila]AOS46159.1 invasion protein regulator [Lacunisphaera limnophila]